MKFQISLADVSSYLRFGSLSPSEDEYLNLIDSKSFFSQLITEKTKVFNFDFNFFYFLNKKFPSFFLYCDAEFQHIQKFRVEVFKETIVIYLNDKGPLYYLEGSRNLEYHKELQVTDIGYLTDNDFNVVAFVLDNISPLLMTKFIITLSENNIDITPQEKIWPKRNSFVNIENKDCLMKEIMKLKNVNISELLYYGFKRYLIDEQFIVDFACHLMEQSKADGGMVEIAGLLEGQLDQVEELMIKHVKDSDSVLEKHGEKYNRIWFYLTLATDMCQMGIIE